MGISPVLIKSLNRFEPARTKDYIVAYTEGSLETVVLDSYSELFAFDLISSTHDVGQPLPAVLFHEAPIALTD